MPSIPLTALEEQFLLQRLGIHEVEELFSSIPPKIRECAEILISIGDNPPSACKGLSEHDLRTYFGGLAAKNATAPAYVSFQGGGYYDNIIPAIVHQLVLRGEFLTCYTPYQPEISQGTLQAIFEFQTMICRLTQMEVANASMYDGPTATAEAALMAQRLSKGSRQILIAASTPPHVKEVVQTFLKSHSPPPLEIPWNKDGTLDFDSLKKQSQENDPCALIVASPNYFGLIEPLDEIRRALGERILVTTISDPSSFGIFEPPGAFGADIVVGEAHQFGTPLLFGGPHVGFFATRKTFLRQMPGRLCGETIDSRGQRAYALTLSTREQHIRREKATSNICTNQGLIALRTAIYLSFLGKRGLQELAETNYSLFEALTEKLEAQGIPRLYRGQGYREGVFQVPNLKYRFQKALTKGIVPGIPLQQKFPNHPELEDCLLVAVHPKHTLKHLDSLVEALTHD